MRKALRSYWLLIPLALLFLFVVHGAWGIYLKDRDSALALRASKEGLSKIQDRQDRLSAAIGKLQTESGIEQEIRDRFKVAKDGEHEIIIVEDPNAKKSAPPQKKNLLQKVIDFFTIR